MAVSMDSSTPEGICRFLCPRCGHHIVVPAQVRGKKGTCRGCGVKLRIPRLSPATAQVSTAEISDFDSFGVPQSAISEMPQEAARCATGEVQLQELKQLQLQLAQPAQAAENPVIGVPTKLSVRPVDEVEPECRYTWSVVSKPAEAALPIFGVNGSHNARETQVRFYRPGEYVVRVTVRMGEQTKTSDVTLRVARAMA
jgi:hypothetical protein